MSESNHVSTKNSNSNSQSILLAVLVVLVLCGLSFYGGTVYEKGRKTVPVNTANAPFGGGAGGRFGGQRPNIGTVTTVGADSIAISASDGSSKTFTISSTTQFNNNGQSAAVSDIKTGDRVLVRTASSTSTQATQIDINPSFGGASQSLN